MTGSYLTALAAARVPLRSLFLSDAAVAGTVHAANACVALVSCQHQAAMLHSCYTTHLWFDTLTTSSVALIDAGCQQPELVINSPCILSAHLMQTCKQGSPLPAAGHGAEAAIGQLTRLTSLILYMERQSVDTAPPDDPRTSQRAPQLTSGAAGSAFVPLQLQMLGCGAAASAAGGESGVPGCSSGAGSSLAKRNTSLQELMLCVSSWLSEDELAAAAEALPDLRQLWVRLKNVSTRRT